MLKPAYPSSPYRNPIAHFYLQARDADGEHVFFYTKAYAARYAAHHFITTILNELEDCETHWLDNDQLLITHTPTLSTLLIRGELEDAIEYTPTREEAAWTLPRSDYFRAITFYHQKQEQVVVPVAPPKERQAPKRHKTTKAPQSSNQVTVAQIAEQLNIQPNKARNILRKANIKKPEQGWTFNTNDPMIQTIRKLLSAG